MLGMPDKSNVTYDETSVYDGIMLKFRKKLSMAGMTAWRVQELGGANMLRVRAKKRNLLCSWPWTVGAPVPHPVFTTLHRKFCGTLTPNHPDVCATFFAFRARPPCLNFD
jgi:hypothetical protein